MKERPILFSGPMVRAILGGRKTQERRVVTRPKFRIREDFLPTSEKTGYCFAIEIERGTTRMLGSENFAREFCPFGQPGDRLWVRETWAVDRCYDHLKPRDVPFGNGRHMYYGSKIVTGWHRPRSPIHMPRWASRITLEVTGVRVERVQEISGQDAMAEGIERDESYYAGAPHRIKGTPKCFTLAWQAYKDIWNHLNAKRGYGWDVNPWVWVIEFRKVA